MNYLRITVLIILTAVFATGVVWAGQAPLNEKAIPVFPGAVEDKKARDQFFEEMGDNPEGLLLGLGLELRDEVYKIYSCNTGAEEVSRFYREKLDAKVLNYAVYPEKLEPGETTPVDHELVFYKLKDEIYSDSGDVLYPGELIRRTLAANRSPYQPECWVAYARFEWSVREKNNDLSGYSVTIYDKSFSDNYRSYKTKTWIVVHRQTYRGDDETYLDDEMDHAVAAKAESMKQPTERELGAPVYPGAVFNKELSAGMSMNDDELFYIFQSNDAPAKVVLFYEQKLGKKAVKYGESYMIALKGKLPLPDEGICIEPNKLGGPAKTLITFRKWLGD